MSRGEGFRNVAWREWSSIHSHMVVRYHRTRGPVACSETWATISSFVDLSINMAPKATGFDIARSQISVDKLAKWLQEAISDDISQVPGVGPAAVENLAKEQDSARLRSNILSSWPRPRKLSLNLVVPT